MTQVSRSMKRITLLICCAVSTSCSMSETFRRCGFDGCPGDAAITAEVEARMAKEVGSFDVHVQTLDHVVYLYGIVETDLERLILVSTAQKVPGVSRVVESLGVRGAGY